MEIVLVNQTKYLRASGHRAIIQSVQVMAAGTLATWDAKKHIKFGQ
jgi:hypothetical protein